MGIVPKTIQSILLPVLILAGLLLVASCVLLLIATKRRADQRTARKSAIDQLERAKRRDYITPAEEEEPEQAEEENVTVESNALDEDDQEDLELPHMKYARSASHTAPTEGAVSYTHLADAIPPRWPMHWQDCPVRWTCWASAEKPGVRRRKNTCWNTNSTPNC